MKITVDIDCTPEEARQFLGLPDVQPMQKALMHEVEERMKAALASTEPDALMRTWLPASIDGFEQMQKFFWNQMSGAMGKSSAAGPGASKGKATKDD